MGCEGEEIAEERVEEEEAVGVENDEGDEGEGVSGGVGKRSLFSCRSIILRVHLLLSEKLEGSNVPPYSIHGLGSPII